MLSVHACMGDKGKDWRSTKRMQTPANPLSHLAPMHSAFFERCQGVRSRALVQGRSFKGIRSRAFVQGCSSQGVGSGLYSASTEEYISCEDQLGNSGPILNGTITGKESHLLVHCRQDSLQRSPNFSNAQYHLPSFSTTVVDTMGSMVCSLRKRPPCTNESWISNG